MKPEEFVSKIRQTIIDEGMSDYRYIYAHTEVEEDFDEESREVLKFYKELGEKEKEILFEIIRQVSVDTVSAVFALLDGVSWLEGQEGDFNLTLGNDKQQKLNGDLQDIFLAMEEEER